MFGFILFAYSAWAVLVLRSVLGFIFMVHGWKKLRDLKQAALNMEGMGFKPGRLFGTVAAILEFFGGIAIILGFLTGLTAFLFAGEFVVILCWRLAKRAPFPAYELDLLIFASIIVLIALGAGPFSLDRVLFWGI